MNNHEINRILHSHHRTRNTFLSTIPCNVNENFQKYPFALVMNTDDSSGPGRHWVAIYAISKELAEYFDPVGMPPNECQQKFLKRFKNVKKIQLSYSLFSALCVAIIVFILSLVGATENLSQTL